MTQSEWERMKEYGWGADRYLATAKPPPGRNPFEWIVEVCDEARRRFQPPERVVKSLGRRI